MAASPGATVGQAYRQAWVSLRAEVLTPPYLASVTLTLAIAPLALSAFSAAKQAIPVLHPFIWDRIIATLGTRIDGGTPLWRLLQPAFGHPGITVAVDWFYHRVWTSLLLAVFTLVALMRPNPLRRRFLFCFVLVFLVVGNLLALALSSAGPAYFAAVVPGGTDPFAPLLEYLRSVDARTPLLSFRGEHVLWSAYRHNVEGFGFGVSAMPSVHVALAALVALFGFRLSRWIGLLFSLVAVATFLSSVSLGWHYALDGYVGAFAAYGIWLLGGRVAQNSDPAKRR
jgi:membrane-associated phospholipid phosphatase